MNPTKNGNTFGNFLILAWVVIVGTVAVGLRYGIVIPLEFLTGITIVVFPLGIVFIVFYEKYWKVLIKEATKMNPKQKERIEYVVIPIVLIACVAIILSIAFSFYTLFQQVEIVEMQRMADLMDNNPNLSCEQIIEHVEEAGHKYSLLQSGPTKLNWLGWLRYAEYQGC